MKKIFLHLILALGIIACTNTSGDKAATQIGKKEIIADLGETKMPDDCTLYFSKADLEQICENNFIEEVTNSEVEGKNCIREYTSEKDGSIFKLAINRYASNAAVRSAFNVLKKDMGGEAVLNKEKTQKGRTEINGKQVSFRYFIADKYLVIIKSLDNSETTCLNDTNLAALTETLIKRLGDLPQ